MIFLSMITGYTFCGVMLLLLERVGYLKIPASLIKVYTIIGIIIAVYLASYGVYFVVEIIKMFLS